MEQGTRLRADVDRTVTAALEAASRRSARVMLEYYGETWTGEQLVEAVGRLAAGLTEAGVNKGDRVAVLAPNMPEQILLFLAAARIGAMHTPINPQWMEDETRYLLQDSGARVLVCSLETVQVAVAAMEGTDVELLYVIQRDAGGQDHDTYLPPGSLPFADLTAARSEARDGAAPDDPLCLWYTSGTTGRPKGAVWTHKNFLFNSLAWMEAFGLTDETVAIAAAPIAHNGLGIGALAPMLLGGRLHLLRGVDPTEMLDVIRREQVTYMATVPAIMAILSIRAEAMGITELPSFRVLAIGAAPTPPAQLEQLQALLPKCAVFHSFGASEGHFSTCSPDALPAKLGSVGTPLPGNSVKVVDDTGTELPSGTVGSIAVRGPGVMREYWRNPAATAKVLNDGWLSIGDLGSIDEDGFLWIAGRDRDVINSGGYNVYASEIEQAVVSWLPSVQTVAAVGEADDVLGERVVLYVAPHEGQTIDEESVVEVCNDRLAKYKRPRAIKVVDYIPVNSLGKVQKHLLNREGPVR